MSGTCYGCDSVSCICDEMADAEAASEAHEDIVDALAAATADRDALAARLAEMWWAAWCLLWCALGEYMSAEEWCNEWAGCPLPETLAEVAAERDAAGVALGELLLLVQRYYDECGLADDCAVGERLIAALANKGENP